jgi:hypothetical protein
LLFIKAGFKSKNRQSSIPVCGQNLFIWSPAFQIPAPKTPFPASIHQCNTFPGQLGLRSFGRVDSKIFPCIQ